MKDIVKYSDEIEDVQWQEIVNDLTTALTEEDIPEDVIKAAEMLVSGFPLYQIAAELKTNTKKIRSWLTKYPKMTLAVAQAKQNLSKYRLQKLEPMFFHALEKAREVLIADSYVELDEENNVISLHVPNAKLLGVQAQMARYIISLFMGNKTDININIKDERPLLKASEGAMDYIAQKLLEQRDNHDVEPVEAIVRVLDPKEQEGPMLDDEGNPNFGELGLIDNNDEGTLCHICGNRFKRLDIHTRVKHNISNEMYETIFMLSPGTLRKMMEEIYDKKEEESES